MLSFNLGDLVEVVGKMGGEPWPYARGIVTGFFFGPTQDMVTVTILQSETSSARVGSSLLYHSTSIRLVQ